ncbi:hypothetical protein KIPB_011944, partial [Kipferlia bialata]
GDILDGIRVLWGKREGNHQNIIRPAWPDASWGDRRHTDILTPGAVPIMGWATHSNHPQWTGPCLTGLQPLIRRGGLSPDCKQVVVDETGQGYEIGGTHLKCSTYLTSPHGTHIPKYLVGARVWHGQYVNGFQPLFGTPGCGVDQPEDGEGMFGVRQGQMSELLAPEGQVVVGFSGRSGCWFDALYLHYSPLVDGVRIRHGQVTVSEKCGGNGGGPLPFRPML